MSTTADIIPTTLAEAVEQRVAIEILYPGSAGTEWREIRPYRFADRYQSVIHGVCLTTERVEGMDEVPEAERPYDSRAWRRFRISDIRDWQPVAAAAPETNPDQLELEAPAADSDAVLGQLRQLSGGPVEIVAETAVRVIWRKMAFAQCEATADTLSGALAAALAMERDFHR